MTMLTRDVEIALCSGYGDLTKAAGVMAASEQRSSSVGRVCSRTTRREWASGDDMQGVAVVGSDMLTRVKPLLSDDQR